jgi:3'-5' exoribonuclease
MPSVLDLPSLRPGDRVQDTLLVLDTEHKHHEGGAYDVVTFGNATGRIPSAPFWAEDQPYVEGIRKGHVVQVIGEVQEYRGHPQLRVTAPLRLLPEGSADFTRLLPSVGDVSRYWETLDGWRREMQHPRLARVLSLFYDDDDFRRRYGQCPASVSGHHAALGGLLKHTVEVAAIARVIARVCGADQDAVLAGVLLHDIGKLESYRWDSLFDYTESHYLIGHVVLGSLLLDRRLAEEPNPACTDDERAMLHHLILSHHGRREFGSPVTPASLEAEVIHWADNASAKTASMAEALRAAEGFAPKLRRAKTSREERQGEP